MDEGLFIKDEFVPATLWKRLMAFFIDQVLIGIMLIPISNILGNIFGIKNVPIDVDQELPSEVVLFLTFLILAYLFLTYILSAVGNLIHGGSPGKLAMGIRTVVLPNGEKLGPLRTLVREILTRTLSNIFFIGYFPILIRKDGRALHDLLSETQVITKESSP